MSFNKTNTVTNYETHVRLTTGSIYNS